jgi:arginase
VVWIDAHADIHTPYTTPSGNIHGMPLAASFAIDNKECQSNDVDELTATLWNQLKNIGNISPKINPEDLIYVGVRSTEAQEDAIIKRLGIRNIPVSEIHDLGIDQITASIENHLQHCDMIYVSFDVDSMDPNLISNGTGTPVQNGLTPSEATTLLVALMQNPKTICMEVVEVNPCLDNKGNAMAEAAFAIIDTIVTTIKV